VHAAGNELLNFLKGLEADQVKSLTLVSDDGVEAMNTFIHRLLGMFVAISALYPWQPARLVLCKQNIDVMCLVCKTR